MDNLDNPAVWGLIWLGLAASFAIGEIVAVGTFFLMPFAVGAAVAALASFANAPVPLSFVVFIVSSLGAFFALRPLARRLEIDMPNPIGVGANRLIGDTGEVLDDIPPGVTKSGLVYVAGEKWRAEGRDGMGVMAGTRVTIIEVRGTRVIVEPTQTNAIP